MSMIDDLATIEYGPMFTFLARLVMAACAAAALASAAVAAAVVAALVGGAL